MSATKASVSPAAVPSVEGFYRLARFAVVLAFAVVVLGAYVRLSDAGLGCPDWPGCYGRLDVPSGETRIALANAAFPGRPVEVGKAWKEMVHRYFAGALGLVILGLAITAWRRRADPAQPLALPLALLALVIFQALLGMWTVTLLLKPVVVLAHLLGGFATLAALWWLVLHEGRYFSAAPDRALRPWVIVGLAVVVGQVALGGWTSANYAALACPDFPTCQGQWWPPLDFAEAFTLWRGLGVDYEGGVLDNTARVTIHVVHRLGALTVVAYLGWMLWRIVTRTPSPTLRGIAIAIALLLAAQVSLGIANVLFFLPLPVAVAHNAVAALLVLALVTLNHALHPERSP